MNKRVFSLFVTVLGLMLVVAACGGQTTEAPVVVTDAPVVATEAPVVAAATRSAADCSMMSGSKSSMWMPGRRPAFMIHPDPTPAAASSGAVRCHGWDYRVWTALMAKAHT